MPREYVLGPAATLADVSDRTARDIGSARIRAGSTIATDGRAEAVVAWRNQGDIDTILAVEAFISNGSTLDRIRNLQGGGHKFGLATGDPRYASVWGTQYFGLGDPVRGNAAVNQFLVYRLRNPGASGKTLIVHYIAVRWSAARRFAIRLVATIAADRTTVLTAGTKSSAGGANVAVLSLDTNVAANLAIVVHAEILQVGVRAEYTQPLRIAAGDYIDVQLGDVTDAAGETGDFEIEWSEE